MKNDKLKMKNKRAKLGFNCHKGTRENLSQSREGAKGRKNAIDSQKKICYKGAKEITAKYTK